MDDFRLRPSIFGDFTDPAVRERYGLPELPAAEQPPAAEPLAAPDASPRAAMLRALSEAQGQDAKTQALNTLGAALHGLGTSITRRNIAAPQVKPTAVADVLQQHQLGAAVDDEARKAQIFGPQLTTATEKARYAGEEAASDAALKRAHAAVFGQQAAKGASELEDAEAFRRALRAGDSRATAIVLGLARKWNPEFAAKLEGASGAEIYPTLPLMEKGYQAEQAAKARVAVARAAGDAGMSLTPEALDQAAQTYLTTGQLPQLGMGRSGAAIKTRIANRAAEMDPEADLAGNKAGFGANKASLQKLQTQADAVNAFERTAMANLDRFLETSKGVVDTGSPLWNAPARRFAEKVSGDPKLTQFNVARQVAVQEIGKVLSGAMGSAAISDSARHEVEQLLSPDASLAQIHAAAEILRNDMHNRRAAFDAELAHVRGRTAGKKTEPEKTADPLGVR